MTIVREGDRLVLINSVRLAEAGLKALEALGRVTDVIRLAGFHGADDAFYKERYAAKVWAIKGQRYTAGFDFQARETHLEPDREIDASSELPLSRASVYLFDTQPPEALLLLARDGGVVIAGDSLQNFGRTDRYFNWFGALVMKLFGFIKPYNVGPAWLKQAKPSARELLGLLELDFEHVLPAHGAAVIGGARPAFRPALEKAAAQRA